MNFIRGSRRAGVVAAVLLAALVSGGCAGTRATPTRAVEAATTATAAAPEWRRTELYFALRRAGEVGGETDDGPWSDARWQRFLDEVVTPEFPAGLSVVDAYGQWRNSQDGKVYGLTSRIVVLLHEATAENDARIERVRAEFKRVTGQESVLRGTQAAEVGF